jgi:hypothetical protein
VVVSALLVVAIVVGGVGTTSWIPREARLRFEERIAGGIVVGVLTMSICAFGVFELFGMGLPAVLIGTGIPFVIGIVGMVQRRSMWRVEVRSAWRRLRLPTARAASLRPLVVFSSLAAVVSTRTLALAYQSTPTGVRAGSLATWADWAAHHAYAGSFAYGDNRGLDLPIAAGEEFRYHFLADFFGSVFTVSGATLSQSLVISAWMLAIALPPLLWCAVLRLVGSRSAAGISVLLFLLSGGLGSWYFVRDLEQGGWDIWRALPRTYARIGDEHIWVDNTISASFFAQRSTQLGWATGALALIVILASRPSWRRAGFAWAGVLIGTTGISQAHMLGTAVALGVFALIADRQRTWWWFLIPALAIGAPLSWSIRPQQNSMRWLVGWMAQDADQLWIWFWLRNVGLLLPLFAIVTLFGAGVPRRVRRLTTPLWLWFVVPNLVAFHPSEWNNTKFFLFWQFAGCIAVGTWLSKAFAAPVMASAVQSPSRRRLIAPFVASMCVLVMISAGGLDAVRAMQRGTAIDWVAEDDVAAASWLRAHSDPDAVIVYGAHNTSAVAALGGRRAVSGNPGWLFDLGLVDWSDRASASGAILRADPGVDDLIDRYGVDFVVIGPRERLEHQANDARWDEQGELVFAAGEYRIYQVR